MSSTGRRPVLDTLVERAASRQGQDLTTLTALGIEDPAPVCAACPRARIASRDRASAAQARAWRGHFFFSYVGVTLPSLADGDPWWVAHAVVLHIPYFNCSGGVGNYSHNVSFFFFLEAGGPKLQVKRQEM